MVLYLVFCFKKKKKKTLIKNCSSDRENLLKFKADGREFAKVLWSLEQFVQTVKGKKFFGNRMLF